MKVTLAALFLGITAVTAIPSPTQVEQDAGDVEIFVSVSVIDEVAYLHFIYKHRVDTPEVILSVAPGDTVIVSTTVTTTVTNRNQDCDDRKALRRLSCLISWRYHH